LKVGGLYGGIPLPSSVLDVVCADSALYMASEFYNTTCMNMPFAAL